VWATAQHPFIHNLKTSHDLSHQPPFCDPLYRIAQPAARTNWRGCVSPIMRCRLADFRSMHAGHGCSHVVGVPPASHDVWFMKSIRRMSTSVRCIHTRTYIYLFIYLYIYETPYTYCRFWGNVSIWLHGRCQMLIWMQLRKWPKISQNHITMSSADTNAMTSMPPPAWIPEKKQVAAAVHPYEVQRNLLKVTSTGRLKRHSAYLLASVTCPCICQRFNLQDVFPTKV
jgi:hypothetical protein